MRIAVAAVLLLLSSVGVQAQQPAGKPSAPAPGNVNFNDFELDPYVAKGGKRLDLDPGRLEGKATAKAEARNEEPSCSYETARRLDLGRDIKQTMPRECRPGLRIGNGRITVTPRERWSGPR